MAAKVAFSFLAHDVSVALADQGTNMTQFQVEKVLRAFIDVTRAHLLDGASVSLPQLCILEMRLKRGREIINPLTSQPCSTPAHLKLGLREAASLRKDTRDPRYVENYVDRMRGEEQ